MINTYKISGASGEFTVKTEYELQEFIQLVAASTFIMSDDKTGHLPPFWKIEKLEFKLEAVKDKDDN